MRRRRLKICAKAGCGKPTKERFCETHKKERYASFDRTRETSTARGYDYKWYKFQDYFLNKNPLCKFCLEKNVITEATEVDHIITLRSRPDLKFEESNCRALCKPCHSRRTYQDQVKPFRDKERSTSSNGEGLFNL